MADIVTPSVVILIFVNRTWAIYLRSRKTLAFIGILGLIVMAFEIEESTAQWLHVCSMISVHPQSLLSESYIFFTPKVLPVARSLSLAFDSAVFWLTFYKTFHIARSLRRQGIPNSLTHKILYDGFMYYLSRIALVANIIGLPELRTNHGFKPILSVTLA
ncbi:hypothetical protein BD410DRAFT_830190 [Rickenella mellea]|uniref:Uncharacterized protein n=1 Tax=Rickenella mellea TaxID=50990 RepID=A0A4Y7PWG9_9AGAM|nr:hypothetical protein BD410DRAFT_830190 [Rickenella mellea]